MTHTCTHMHVFSTQGCCAYRSKIFTRLMHGHMLHAHSTRQGKSHRHATVTSYLRYNHADYYEAENARPGLRAHACHETLIPRQYSWVVVTLAWMIVGLCACKQRQSQDQGHGAFRFPSLLAFSCGGHQRACAVGKEGLISWIVSNHSQTEDRGQRESHRTQRLHVWKRD